HPGRLLPGVRIEPYYQPSSVPSKAVEVIWTRAQFPIGTPEEAASMAMRQVRRLFMRQPEVQEVVSQVGRAEGTLDLVGFDRAQAVVVLRPVAERPKAPGKDQARTWQQITEEVGEQLIKELPGVGWDLTPEFREEMQTDFVPGAGQGLLRI